MVKLSAIDAPGGQFFVEVVEIEELPKAISVDEASKDFPPGSEQISAANLKSESFVQVRSLLGHVAGLVSQAINEHKPNETEVEISLGFGGGTGIPFIASGKAEAGLKIKLKWRADGKP